MNDDPCKNFIRLLVVGTVFFLSQNHASATTSTVSPAPEQGDAGGTVQPLPCIKIFAEIELSATTPDPLIDEAQDFISPFIAAANATWCEDPQTNKIGHYFHDAFLNDLSGAEKIDLQLEVLDSLITDVELDTLSMNIWAGDMDRLLTNSAYKHNVFSLFIRGVLKNIGLHQPDTPEENGVDELCQSATSESIKAVTRNQRAYLRACEFIMARLKSGNITPDDIEDDDLKKVQKWQNLLTSPHEKLDIALAACTRANDLTLATLADFTDVLPYLPSASRDNPKSQATLMYLDFYRHLKDKIANKLQTLQGTHASRWSTKFYALSALSGALVTAVTAGLNLSYYFASPPEIPACFPIPSMLEINRTYPDPLNESRLINDTCLSPSDAPWYGYALTQSIHDNITYYVSPLQSVLVGGVGVLVGSSLMLLARGTELTFENPHLRPLAKTFLHDDLDISSQADALALHYILNNHDTVRELMFSNDYDASAEEITYSCWGECRVRAVTIFDGIVDDIYDKIYSYVQKHPQAKLDPSKSPPICWAVF